MDPITAALEGFDLTNILAVGAIGITIALVYVNIGKVKELVTGEGKETFEEYYDRMSENHWYDEKEDRWRDDWENHPDTIEEERYDHYVMSNFVDSENLSESENERWGAYYDKYGSAYEFSEADQVRYTERFRSEFAFDDDD